MKRGELKRKSEIKRAANRAPKQRFSIEGGKTQKESLASARRREQRAALRWNLGIRGSVCVACCKRPAVEGHHIIRLQVLRREAKNRGFDFDLVRWDARNRLPLCKHCHANHHSRAAPLSKELLLRVARWVYDFASEHDLTWAIDREYV
jgi:hypothetical protein